jgi:hypothetical protein
MCRQAMMLCECSGAMMLNKALVEMLWCTALAAKDIPIHARLRDCS